MVNHRATWRLRPVDQEDDDDALFDNYENNPEFFTIKVHYKGTFHLTPLREYKDGKLRIIDKVNEDFFNLTDMDVIALGVGYKYKSFVLYLWRMPETSLDNGLRPLSCDADVHEFLFHASYYMFMDVYLDDTPMKNICRIFASAPSCVEIRDFEMVEQEDNDYNLVGHVEEPVEEIVEGDDDSDILHDIEEAGDEVIGGFFDIDNEGDDSELEFIDEDFEEQSDLELGSEDDEAMMEFDFDEEEFEEEAVEPVPDVAAPRTPEREDQINITK